MTNANALPIQDAVAELRDLVSCRCNDAYTGRGLHDPDCQCDSKDAVKAVTDRIDALEKALEPFAFLDPDNPDRTTQEFWEMIYRDRVQDWYDYEDIAAARAALGEGE